MGTEAHRTPGPTPELTGTGDAGGRGILLVLAAALVLLLSFLGNRELCNPDEPREAECARETAEGHWSVAPEVNGYPFRERPPLYYWLVASSFRVSGEPTDASAKVPSALLGVLTVFAGWILGEQLIGRGRGWLPAAFFLGTHYLFLRFRICTTDAGLTAFTALSLALFFAAWRRGSWVLSAAAGAAAGLAFLCKGLLGPGIPALVAGAWLLWKRDLHAVLRLRLWLAVLVGVAVAAPWLWAVWQQQGPEWLRAFFVEQHLGRLGAEADHARPPWYYVRVLWVALPHTPLLLAGVLSRRPGTGPGGDAFLAGALWIGVPLALLSAIGGKRNVYLLPLLPGAALAAAAVVEAAALGALGEASGRVVRATLAVLEVLTLQFLVPGTRSLRVRAATALVGLAALGLVLDAFALSRFNRERSGRVLAARAAELAGRDPLILFRVGEGDVGQFAFPLRRRLPLAWSEPRLLRLLGPGRAVVLCDRRVFEEAAGNGDLSSGLLASLRRLEEGIANEESYLLLEWDGNRAGLSPPVPPGER